ncbi:MAG TPA: hypothetical protein VFJ74_05535, partial [Gemmatimonadaceae bacterium]|nr:hypothetical protein [Gemmatimonadaceae bacterium]
MPSLLAQFTRRSVAGRATLAVVVAITAASLAPTALAAQRVVAPRFQPLPPAPVVVVEPVTGPGPRVAHPPRQLRRHRFTCAQARVIGGTGGAVIGAFSGLVLGTAAMLATGPYEPGTARARAANRRTRVMTIGGAVLGATGGVLMMDC